MVGMGVLMLLTSWWATFLLIKNRGKNIWLLRALSWMTFSGWVAVVAGWYVTEIGRQPWIVYGLLSTKDVVANHSGGTVLSTLIIYLLLYGFLLVSYILTLRYLSSQPARSLTTLQQQAQEGQSNINLTNEGEL
jgi:cytochrome d ubiquinol oxidase subunit I